MTTISFQDFVKNSGGKPTEVKVISNAGGSPPVVNTPPSDNKSFLQKEVSGAINTAKDIGGDIVNTAKNVGGSLKKGYEGIRDATNNVLDGKRSAPGGGLDVTAAVMKTASGVIGDIFKGSIKLALPQNQEDQVKHIIEQAGLHIAPVVNEILSHPAVKQAVEAYANAPENEKQNIRSLTNIGSGIFDILTAGEGKKAAEVAGTAVKDAAGTAADAVAKTATEAAAKVADLPGVSSLVDAAKGTKDVAAMAAEGLARIPDRIATNVADKQAIRESVKALPTKTAQIAARDGVQIPDVKYLYELPADQKAPLQKLATVAKNFAEGKTKTNPIEVVGKPIVARLKELDAARSTVGKQLGAVADTLGPVSTKELASPVFNSLRRVPGLAGLKVDAKGVLDFTDTAISTALSKSDRNSIQQVFTEAVKGGTGKQKHLLRQELFEILGGKKKSLTAMTDTQDKAFQAVREGLSTVLESKNADYKTLSAQYRKIVQPLGDMRKLMKNVSGGDEDILDMSAGLLARRLTSNAPSNPQIRQILRNLDAATAIPGKARLNVENLQDFYNVLNKYYDIAGKTSFQGQVSAGIDNSSSVQGAVMGALKKMSGQTQAVRIKAFENALQEALSANTPGQIMKMEGKGIILNQ